MTHTQRADVGLDPELPVTYRMVEHALRQTIEALSEGRIEGWDLARFGNAVVAASIPPTHPVTGAIAIDSTDIETWARLRSRKPVPDTG